MNQWNLADSFANYLVSFSTLDWILSTELTAVLLNWIGIGNCVYGFNCGHVYFVFPYAKQALDAWDQNVPEILGILFSANYVLRCLDDY